jgi:hypothetical protein
VNHKELAKQNVKDASNSKWIAREEWKITAYFYAALHGVTHHLADHGHEVLSLDHEARKDALLTSGLFNNQLRVSYAKLKALSSDARYKPHKHPMGYEKVEEARDYAKEILHYVLISV